MFGKVIGLLIGFGVSLDLSGAVAGLLIGAMFDFYLLNIEKPQRADDAWQTEFSHLFIMLHAKFAKVDGQVTSSEVRAFQDMISVTEDDIDTVRAIYNKYRKSADGFEHVAVRLSELLILRDKDRRLVMDSLCAVGMINGSLNLYQGAFIQAVGRILAFSDDEIDMIKHETVPGADYVNAGADKATPDAKLWADISALKALGLKRGVTKDEIRKAYKKFIRLYHPDKLRGEGADEKTIRKAESKLAELNEAYAVLMKK
ncbi:MAG: DnaJ like chaperone protein [bacterium]